MKKLMAYLLIMTTAFMLTIGTVSQRCYADDSGGDYVEDPNGGAGEE